MMEERTITHEKEKVDQMIDKCVLGKTFSDDRSDACSWLANECVSQHFHEMDDVSEQLIEEIAVREKEFSEEKTHGLSSESGEEIKETVGEEKEEIFGVHRPLRGQETGFYTFVEGSEIDPNHPTKNTKKEYIDRMKEKKFGICHLALFGIEQQFMEQTSIGLFQKESNAEAVEDIEYNLLRPKKDNNKYFRLTNLIHNPLLKGTYRAVTEAKMDGKSQNWLIEEKKSTFKTKSGEIIEDKYSLQKMWDSMGKDDREWLLNKTYHGPESEKLKHYSYNALFGSGIPEKIMNYIIKGIDDKRLGELSNIEKTAEKWEAVAILRCLHNWLSYTKAEDALEDEWKKIAEAVNKGDISQKEGEKQMKHLLEVKKEKITSFEGEPGVGIKHVTMYQPTRIRLWGAQSPLVSMLNDVLLEVRGNIDVVAGNNSITRNFLRKAFKDEPKIRSEFNL